MTKIIKIDSCTYCPYKQEGNPFIHYQIGFCTNAKSSDNEGSLPREILFQGIPDWCPLDDVGIQDVLAVIEFAIHDDEPAAFLKCWQEGDWETIRNEWPDFKLSDDQTQTSQR